MIITGRKVPTPKGKSCGRVLKPAVDEMKVVKANTMIAEDKGRWDEIFFRVERGELKTPPM
jgi:hypothetical protein